ncbi:MAG: hypothetical protein QOH25_60 [Acidobacteriota bacterium]|jgi:hypothetical protein|nr:hypothetical protein [Acidobacteriota bacterium]
MSKQIRLQAIAALVVVLILAAVLPSVGVVVTQAQSVAVASTRDARNAAVVEATADVLKETSEVRQLPILRPVKSGTQSRDEIQRFLIKNMDEDITPAEMHASEVALKKLGLVPADFQFRPFIIGLLTEQVAGYYDPKQQEFFLADWIDLDGQQPVMSHELTHALQDQHFNLRRFEKWPKGDSDAELAAHALVEGDASLTMAVYVARSPLRIISLMKSMGATKSATEEIDRAPRAIRESLLFPYEQGMQWAQVLYRREGWPLVSKAFTDLPQSTEQILHAEKYFAREAPIKVTLPDISSALGKGWKRIDTDVNGEWSYYLILDEYLKSAQDSKRAAAGWGGDRYAVYEGAKPGEVVIVQVSAWDTPHDAMEFFDAYKKRTELRYPGATPIRSPYTDFSTKWHDGQAWRTQEGLVFVVRNSDRVVVMEGLPEGMSLKKLDGLFGMSATQK